MSDQTIDRTELPIRRPSFQGVEGETLDGSQPDWGLIGHVKPPRVLFVTPRNGGRRMGSTLRSNW